MAGPACLTARVGEPGPTPGCCGEDFSRDVRGSSSAHSPKRYGVDESVGCLIGRPIRGPSGVVRDAGVAPRILVHSWYVREYVRVDLAAAWLDKAKDRNKDLSRRRAFTAAIQKTIIH